LGHYAGTLRHAIHLLKYDQKPALAEPLGHLLAHYLQSEESLRNLSFDAVVPVPLHSSRRRERGFNQAERLARVIAKECGIPLNAHSLLRIRATRAQASLGGDSRRGNLDGAFALRHPNAFAGKSLLLVDDVLTTMSTVSACARILKNGGATQVIILGLARGG
jgi:ComF family protein